jgi:hypothetical protein
MPPPETRSARLVSARRHGGRGGPLEMREQVACMLDDWIARPERARPGFGIEADRPPLALDGDVAPALVARLVLVGRPPAEELRESPLPLNFRRVAHDEACVIS